MYKRITAVALAVLLLICPVSVAADEIGVDLKLDEDLPVAAQVSTKMSDSLPAKAAILVEQNTGRVLFEQNADQQLAPASITKIMTMLLVMEALDSGKITLEEMVVASETASGMGGSQIWLEPGEQMSVNHMLKAVAIASANDAAAALGEHVAGSLDAFIDMMNIRAEQLGMDNTHFLNCTGLDEDGHLTTARDISVMARELMKHPKITEYSTTWIDTLRDGETELVNTNKLVRFYKGATGLKTGTTSGAGVCLAATASRDNLSLISVVLGSVNSNDRFAASRGLLDYGFSHYVSVEPPSLAGQVVPVKVLRGALPTVEVTYEDPGTFVVEKGSDDSITQEITLVPDVMAPVEKGQVLGKVEVVVNGELVGTYELKAKEDVSKLSFANAFAMLTKSVLKMNNQPETTQTDLPDQAEEMGEIETLGRLEIVNDNQSEADVYADGAMEDEGDYVDTLSEEGEYVDTVEQVPPATDFQVDANPTQETPITDAQTIAPPGQQDEFDFIADRANTVQKDLAK